jgi:hypothetical protein
MAKAEDLSNRTPVFVLRKPGKLYWTGTAWVPNWNYAQKWIGLTEWSAANTAREQMQRDTGEELFLVVSHLLVPDEVR